MGIFFCKNILNVVDFLNVIFLGLNLYWMLIREIDIILMLKLRVLIVREFSKEEFLKIFMYFFVVWLLLFFDDNVFFGIEYNIYRLGVKFFWYYIVDNIFDYIYIIFIF